MKKLTKYERAVLIFLISLQILILTSNITDGSNNGSILNSMLQETKDLFIEYREKVKREKGESKMQSSYNYEEICHFYY